MSCLERILNRCVEECRCPVASRDQHVQGLVDAADTREAVGAHQVVVEAGHRKAAYEGVDPDSNACKLDGDRIDVEAIDAATRDLAAQQRRPLGQRSFWVTDCISGCVAQEDDLLGHARDLMTVFFQEGGHFLLDVVDGRSEEVTRTHRKICDSEVEEQLGRPGLVASLDECCDPG